MQSPKKLLCKSIQENTFPTYKKFNQPQSLSYLHSELGIQKLRSALNYNKYLAQIRNHENDQTYTHGGSKHKSINERLKQASLSIFQNYSQQYSEAFQKQQQIKWSSEISDASITQNMIRVSKRMDQYLETGFYIPKIDDVYKESNQTQETNLCNRSRLKTESLEAETKQNEKEKFEKQLNWKKSGVPLDIVPKGLSEKIQNVMKSPIYSKKLLNESSLKSSKSKNKNFSLYSQVIFEQNIYQTQKFIGTPPKQKNQNANSVSQQKQEGYNRNSLLLDQALNTTILKYQKPLIQSALPQRKSKIYSPQIDLQKVYSNYKRKCEIYGKNDTLMTEQRKAGLFTNELMKVARKYDTLDALSSFIKQKQQQNREKHPKSIKQIEMKRQDTKLPFNQLKQTCRQALAQINNLNIQKL